MAAWRKETEEARKKIAARKAEEEARKVAAARKKEEARTILLVSVRCYPWNWSAWLDLGKVSMDNEVVEHMEQELPPHAMTQFFLGHMFRELQQHTDALDIYGRLEHMFPSSKHVLSEKALVSYHMRDFDESEELFEQLRDKDPYRLDSIDTYSNILYVKEKGQSQFQI